jgi:hypothetical protein
MLYQGPKKIRRLKNMGVNDEENRDIEEEIQ